MFKFDITINISARKIKYFNVIFGGMTFKCKLMIQ